MNYPSKIRLSISTLELFHTCERKYQLIELIQGNEAEREESAIFTFGQAWGAGVVEYLLTGSLDAAVYKAWLNYRPGLEDSGRTEEVCFHGLRMAEQRLKAMRDEYEIAEFNGKPAIELGFRLNINDRFYFESAMDAALRRKRDGSYSILENKHTYSWLEDITPMYKNSIQGLLYSITLDAIAKQELGHYELNYFVGQFSSKSPFTPKIHLFPWKKTLLDRLNCFLSLSLDVQRLQQCVDIDLFPMRGHSCLRFNKPCYFFGTCQMRSKEVKKTDEYILKNKNEHVKEIESQVQFEYNLPELIKNHIERVQEGY